MHYRVDYDEDVWVRVPVADDGPWPDEVVARYERRLGPLEGALADRVRAFAEVCGAARTDDTHELFLFCPLAMTPVVGLLALRVVQVDEPTDLDRAVAHDPTAMIAPTVDSIVSPMWGEGRRAAVVTASSAEGAAAGRFNYAFERQGTVLLATAIADRVTYATAMLPFADRLVSSVGLEE
jgi:hypothetical protein